MLTSFVPLIIKLKGCPLLSAFCCHCQGTSKTLRRQSPLLTHIVTYVTDYGSPEEYQSHTRVSSSIHVLKILVMEACTIQGRDSRRRIGVSGLRDMVMTEIGINIFALSVAVAVLEVIVGSVEINGVDMVYLKVVVKLVP